jgi:hypothetical protein
VTTILATLGVDGVQWKAVTRTLLRTDFRLPLVQSGSLGRIGGLLTTTAFLGIFGSGAAVIVVMGRDVLLTGTVALTYLSVMLASSLLTQHGMTLLTTVDYVILGSRPVSSRTFLAIRVTNVLFHALLVTSLMAYPVVLAYIFAHGLDLFRGLAAAVAIYVWAIALSLVLVTSYATVLTAVGPARFRRVIGYVQLLGGFLAYGGLMLASRLLPDTSFRRAAMPDEWWLLLIPPAWYASYLELATGATNSTTIVRAALSLVALAVLAAALRGQLGLRYAARLADLSTTVDAPASGLTRTPFFRREEARAVAVLVFAHFRHDLRVRLGVLAIVPLVFFYMLLGTQERFDLVALAVLLFPAVLTRHFASSDAHRAAWIYHATPANHARLVTATKDIAVVYFVLPFLCFVAAVFAWRMGDVVQAVAHTTIVGMLSHLAMQSATLVNPTLPFSTPPDKTSGSGSLFAWLFFVIIGGQAALVALDRWVYPSTGRVAISIASLVLLSWCLNRAIAWRVRRLRF